MVNNIGYTTTVLTKEVGAINTFDDVEDIASIGTVSGNLGVGYILFDVDGTMAVCTSVINGNSPTYIFKTSSISGEVTIVTTDEEYNNLIPGQLFVDNREGSTNG